MDMFNVIVRFFQEGGVFMYPIVIVLALGLAISIERYCKAMEGPASCTAPVHESSDQLYRVRCRQVVRSVRTESLEQAFNCRIVFPRPDR